MTAIQDLLKTMNYIYDSLMNSSYLLYYLKKSTEKPNNSDDSDEGIEEDPDLYLIQYDLNTINYHLIQIEKYANKIQIEIVLLHVP